MSPDRTTAPRGKRFRTGIGAALLLALLSGAAVSAYPLRTKSVSLEGFTFDVPASFGDSAPWPGCPYESVGREDPDFFVWAATHPHDPIAVLGRPLEECTPWRVSGRDAVYARIDTIAPGKGGRDHDLVVLLPRERRTLRLSWRTHEEDHGATPLDHLDAWRCRRWQERVLATLAYRP